MGLLALGLVVLRFFPLAVLILARVLEPIGPAWLLQGLRRISRDPILPGSLVVLLMLATSLGVIGSAFSSTLDRSQRDQARYEAGADIRLEHSGGSIPFAALGLTETTAGRPSLFGWVIGGAKDHRKFDDPPLWCGAFYHPRRR